MRPPLPRLLPIVDPGSLADPVGAAARVLGAGAPHLLLRAKGVTGRQLYELAERLNRLARAAGAHLLVGERVDVALAVGAAGVHLPEGGLPPTVARQLLGGERLLGRSCHDPAGARAAFAAGVDYVTLSPLFATATHPGATPLGVERFARWRAAIPGPVLALGGITLDTLPAALAAGADGAALIRGVFDTPRPEALVQGMLQLVSMKRPG